MSLWRQVLIRIIALLQRKTFIETKNRILKCLKRHYSTVPSMKNVSVLTEDGACVLFFRPHPGTFDSSRVPTPGNVPSKPKKKKCGGNFVNIISPCSVLEQSVFRNSAEIEVPGLLDKVLYEEAPPRGPAPYPFSIPFLTEKVPLRIPFLGNVTPFIRLV